MTLLAYVFTKLQTARHVVRQMYKKHPFRTLLDNQHVKRSQKLVKSAWQYFYDFFRHSERKWFGKKPLLVICEILVDFVNTLSADDKFSLRKSEILPQTIQMQLSKKKMTFSELFPSFLKYKSIFEPFEKKDDSHSLYISQITEYKRRGYLNV